VAIQRPAICHTGEPVERSEGGGARQRLPQLLVHSTLLNEHDGDRQEAEQVKPEVQLHGRFCDTPSPTIFAKGPYRARSNTPPGTQAPHNANGRPEQTQHPIDEHQQRIQDKNERVAARNENGAHHRQSNSKRRAAFQPLLRTVRSARFTENRARTNGNVAAIPMASANAQELKLVRNRQSIDFMKVHGRQ